MSISTEDLSHNISNNSFRYFLLLFDELAEVSMGAILHDHVYVRFSSEDIITANYVIVVESPVDFDFPLEQFETGGIEALQFYGLDSIALQLSSYLDPSVDLTTIPLPKHLIQQDLVFAYPDPLLALFVPAYAAILGATAMPQRSGEGWPMERVFLFGQISHFKEYYSLSQTIQHKSMLLCSIVPICKNKCVNVIMKDI